MAGEKSKGEQQTSLEELLKDYALCTIGGEHPFYIGNERPKSGLSDEEIARGLRTSSDPGIGFCPEHYARTGVNQRHKDPATGQPAYRDYELAAIEVWQHLDSTAAEAELAALGMDDIKVLNYQFVMFKGDKKRAMTAQAVAFPSGKYNTDQRKMILQMLLGKQEQPEEQEQVAATVPEAKPALITVTAYDQGNEYAFGAGALINALLGLGGVNDYRVNPENPTQVTFTAQGHLADNPAAKRERERIIGNLVTMDKMVKVHVAGQLETIVRRINENPNVASGLLQSLQDYMK